jgi:hypothetical protein
MNNDEKMIDQSITRKILFKKCFSVFLVLWFFLSRIPNSRVLHSISIIYFLFERSHQNEHLYKKTTFLESFF